MCENRLLGKGCVARPVVTVAIAAIIFVAVIAVVCNVAPLSAVLNQVHVAAESKANII